MLHFKTEFVCPDGSLLRKVLPLRGNDQDCGIQLIWQIFNLNRLQQEYKQKVQQKENMPICLCKSSLPIKVYPRLEFKLLLNLMKMIVKNNVKIAKLQKQTILLQVIKSYLHVTNLHYQ